MKIKASYKERKAERLERIALLGKVKTQVIPGKKKGYTRKAKHLKQIPENGSV
jgi:hypothetical protein